MSISAPAVNEFVDGRSTRLTAGLLDVVSVGDAMISASASYAVAERLSHAKAGWYSDAG